jgi:hypothetical protein
MFVRSINFATFFDFSIGFWNNTDSETIPTEYRQYGNVCFFSFYSLRHKYVVIGNSWNEIELNVIMTENKQINYL